MRPISARSGVVARFAIPREARFILHNKDGAGKRVFGAEVPRFEGEKIVYRS
jgi:hypothetical protein